MNKNNVVQAAKQAEEDDDDDDYSYPICISRIDEFGYCACGSNLGVS
jgi:hypothetical protein